MHWWLPKMLVLALYGSAATAVCLLSFVCSWRLICDSGRLLSMLKHDTQQALLDVFLFIPLAQFTRMLALPWIFTMVLLYFLLPWIIWLVVLPLSFAVPLLYLRIIRRRRQCQFVQQLPDMLVLLSASLQGGIPLLASVQMMAREVSRPMRDELHVLMRQVKLGQSLEIALDDWAKRMPSKDLEQVITAIKLAQHSGGQQGALLSRLADTMRRKQQLELKIQALTAQGRMQGKVMVMLPLLMVIALYFLEQPTMLALSQHPLGWFSAIALTLLLGAGYYLIRLQVQIKVPL